MWKLTKNIPSEKTPTYRSPEYKQFFKLRILSFSSLIGFICLGVILGSFFVYRNIFQTIGQAEQIILVKSNLTALEIIDFAKFDQVKKAWELKNLPATFSLIRDPFSPAPTSTPATHLPPKN